MTIHNIILRILVLLQGKSSLTLGDYRITINYERRYVYIRVMHKSACILAVKDFYTDKEPAVMTYVEGPWVQELLHG